MRSFTAFVGFATASAKGSCEDYFGNVMEGFVTVVDPDVGLTDVSGAYCDNSNHSRPCTFIHYGGLNTTCVPPGPPDGCHRYIVTMYSEAKCGEKLQNLDLTGTIDVADRFTTTGKYVGVLKECVDAVLSQEIQCYGAPADEPVECLCKEPSHDGAILTGFLTGLLADTDDVTPCVHAGVDVGLSFLNPISDFADGHVMKGFDDLAKALRKVQPAGEKCAVVRDELKKLTTDLRHLSPAKIHANYKAHQTEIFVHLTAASEHKDAQEYQAMGLELGNAVRRILEGDAIVL